MSKANDTRIVDGLQAIGLYLGDRYFYKNDKKCLATVIGFTTGGSRIIAVEGETNIKDASQASDIIVGIHSAWEETPGIKFSSSGFYEKIISEEEYNLFKKSLPSALKSSRRKILHVRNYDWKNTNYEGAAALGRASSDFSWVEGEVAGNIIKFDDGSTASIGPGADHALDAEFPEVVKNKIDELKLKEKYGPFEIGETIYVYHNGQHLAANFENFDKGLVYVKINGISTSLLPGQVYQKNLIKAGEECLKEAGLSIGETIQGLQDGEGTILFCYAGAAPCVLLSTKDKGNIQINLSNVIAAKEKTEAFEKEFGKFAVGERCFIFDNDNGAKKLEAYFVSYVPKVGLTIKNNDGSLRTFADPQGYLYKKKYLEAGDKELALLGLKRGDIIDRGMYKGREVVFAQESSTIFLKSKTDGTIQNFSLPHVEKTLKEADKSIVLANGTFKVGDKVSYAHMDADYPYNVTETTDLIIDSVSSSSYGIPTVKTKDGWAASIGGTILAAGEKMAVYNTSHIYHPDSVLNLKAQAQEKLKAREADVEKLLATKGLKIGGSCYYKGELFSIPAKELLRGTLPENQVDIWNPYQNMINVPLEELSVSKFKVGDKVQVASVSLRPPFRVEQTPGIVSEVVAVDDLNIILERSNNYHLTGAAGDIVSTKSREICGKRDSILDVYHLTDNLDHLHRQLAEKIEEKKKSLEGILTKAGFHIGDRVKSHTFTGKIQKIVSDNYVRLEENGKTIDVLLEDIIKISKDNKDKEPLNVGDKVKYARLGDVYPFEIMTTYGLEVKEISEGTTWVVNTNKYDIEIVGQRRAPGEVYSAYTINIRAESDSIQDLVEKRDKMLAEYNKKAETPKKEEVAQVTTAPERFKIGDKVKHAYAQIGFPFDVRCTLGLEVVSQTPDDIQVKNVAGEKISIGLCSIVPGGMIWISKRNVFPLHEELSTLKEQSRKSKEEYAKLETEKRKKTREEAFNKDLALRGMTIGGKIYKDGIEYTIERQGVSPGKVVGRNSINNLLYDLILDEVSTTRSKFMVGDMVRFPYLSDSYPAYACELGKLKVVDFPSKDLVRVRNDRDSSVMIHGIQVGPGETYILSQNYLIDATEPRWALKEAAEEQDARTLDKFNQELQKRGLKIGDTVYNDGNAYVIVRIGGCAKTIFLKNKKGGHHVQLAFESLDMKSPLRKQSERAAYRVAATQLSRLVKTALVRALESKTEGQTRALMLEALDSEFGEALIGGILGTALSRLPNQNSPKIQALSKEFQINAMATAGNAIVDTIANELKPLLLSILQEGEEESTRINSDLAQALLEEGDIEEETQTAEAKRLRA